MEDRKLMSNVQTDIEQLQMKMAFQEDTIESLNQALIMQQKQMDDLQFQLKQLVSKISAKAFPLNLFCSTCVTI